MTSDPGAIFSLEVFIGGEKKEKRTKKERKLQPVETAAADGNPQKGFPQRLENSLGDSAFSQFPQARRRVKHQPISTAAIHLKIRDFLSEEWGAPHGNASIFRVWVEGAGDFGAGEPGSIQSGMALRNGEGVPSTVELELLDANGNPTGFSGSVTLAGNGQVSAFVNQFEGFRSLPFPFRGVLRITGSTALSVVGLRGRYNARGEFLITTILPVDENSAASTAERIFPHFADGMDYTTQFILFSGSAGAMGRGALTLFSQSGESAGVNLP